MNERGRRFLFHLLFIYLPILTLAYIAVIFTLIRRDAVRDDATNADMIIVLGAAQYNGRPSPVFRARLDHTASLFKKNYAGRIMTTGGHGPDRRFSEAGVGKAYLAALDIPEDQILTEPSGQTTLESIERVLRYIELEDIKSVIAVSDGFHLFRIKKILSDHDVRAYGSPAKNSPIESNFRRRVWASLREVFVYTAYLLHRRFHLPISTEEIERENEW